MGESEDKIMDEEPIYMGLDAEGYLTIGAGGWSDVPVELDGKVRLFRVVATGNLAKRIRNVRIKINGGGHRQPPTPKKDLGGP